MMLLDLEELMEQAQSLQALPASAAKVAALVAAPEPDLLQIATVAEADPALAAALLRRANSAASASSRTISTPRDAVMRLGASAVLQTVAGTVARPVLDQALPAYGLRAGELWEHCRVAAIATDLIGKTAKKALPAESATIALLHDIGKLVLARFLSEPLRDLLDRAYQELRSYRLAEREVLGVCQAELGGVLADRWNLPTSISLGITHYHAPQEYANTLGALEPVLVSCHAVHLANFLAKCTNTDQDTNSDNRIPVERTATASVFSVDLIGSMEFLGINPLGFSNLLGRLNEICRQSAEA
jgi:HD-like signal output (HDOD) protein